MTEERPPLTATGSVLLDVGVDAGALIVYVDGRLLGHEVEARPSDHGGRAAHAAVLERQTTNESVHAVVIPGLSAGRYTLWLDDAIAWGDVEVRCGEVHEVDRRGLGR